MLKKEKILEKKKKDEPSETNIWLFVKTSLYPLRLVQCSFPYPSITQFNKFKEFGIIILLTFLKR